MPAGDQPIDCRLSGVAGHIARAWHPPRSCLVIRATRANPVGPSATTVGRRKQRVIDRTCASHEQRRNKKERVLGGSSMRTVVVHDHVDLETIGNGRFELVEEGEKLLGAVSSEALADGPTSRDVQRREKRRRTVSKVATGTSLRNARHSPRKRGRWTAKNSPHGAA